MTSYYSRPSSDSRMRSNSKATFFPRLRACVSRDGQAKGLTYSFSHVWCVGARAGYAKACERSDGDRSLTRTANLTRGAAKGSLVARQQLCDKAEDLASATERARQLERDVKDRRVLVEEARVRLEERQSAYERRIQDVETTRKHANALDRDVGRLQRLLAGDRSDEVEQRQQLEVAREEHVLAQSLLAKAKIELAEANQRRDQLEGDIEAMRNGAAKLVIQTATARNQLLALQSRASTSSSDALSDLKLRLSHLEHVIVEKDKTLMTAREKENRLSDKSVVIHEASRNAEKATKTKEREVASHAKTIAERSNEVKQLEGQLKTVTTGLKRELDSIKETAEPRREQVDRLKQQLDNHYTSAFSGPSAAAELGDRNAIDRSLLDTREQTIQQVETEIAAQRRVLLVSESQTVPIRDEAVAEDGPPPARKRRLDAMNRLRDLAQDPFRPLYAALDPHASFIVLMPSDPAERVDANSEAIVCSENVVTALADAFTTQLAAYKKRPGNLQAQRDRAAQLEEEVAGLEEERHRLAKQLKFGAKPVTRVDPAAQINNAEETVRARPTGCG